EHDPAPPLPMMVAADVEAQVDLVEVPVEGDRHPHDEGVEETEPDHADEGAAVPEIDLGAPGDGLSGEGRRDLAVEQSQVAPLGPQEGPRRHVRGHADSYTTMLTSLPLTGTTFLTSLPARSFFTSGWLMTASVSALSSSPAGRVSLAFTLPPICTGTST